jgi:acetylornithine/N-succinyldiaminopimelate aminotransferase
VAELEQVVATHKVAGILMECIQGEGGVKVVDGEYIKAVAAIAAREDFLFMVDEVQTGNGRTGALYAYMHYGVTPDVVTTAKGLGGGLPIGACILGEKAEGVLGFGDHGSTYGGNPIASAGACSVISRIDDALLAEVREKGEYLRATFTGAKGVKSVSGIGLMVGIETEKPAAEVVKAAIGKGVLALTAKSKVRLLPALNIPMDQLKKAAEILLAIMAE